MSEADNRTLQVLCDLLENLKEIEDIYKGALGMTGSVTKDEFVRGKYLGLCMASDEVERFIENIKKGNI